MKSAKSSTLAGRTVGSVITNFMTIRMEFLAANERQKIWQRQQRIWSRQEDAIIAYCMTHMLDENERSERECWDLIVGCLRGSKSKRECQERWYDYLIFMPHKHRACLKVQRELELENISRKKWASD